MTWQIVYICIFAALTVTLIAMKLLNMSPRKRGVVKTVTSAAFVAAAVVGCVQKGGGLHILLAVGLLFAAVGDVLLIFMDDRRCFIAGVLAFSAASLTLSVYSVLQYGWTWWSAVVFVLSVAANAICQKAKVYSFGRYVWYLNVYTVLVSACGALGLTLLGGGGSALLFGLGCFMYYASDVCLGLYLFKFRNKWVDSVNSLLYFPGMLLVALSLLV